MESKILSLAQFFLRIALSASFLSAVADRFGLWGKPGSAGVNWGSWENFVQYSNAVNSFVPAQLGEMLAIIATSLEVLFPILLLVGYKIRLTAMLSGAMLVSFALAMTVSFGIKPSLDYSVWTGAAACFLLSAIGTYAYSIDNVLSRSKS